MHRHLCKTASSYSFPMRTDGSSPISRVWFELNEPWRVQELPNAEITGREEPDYGRRYEVFYKSLQL
jgi:hypothetical protein